LKTGRPPAAETAGGRGYRNRWFRSVRHGEGRVGGGSLVRALAPGVGRVADRM
jgi:hypothetical protein